MKYIIDFKIVVVFILLCLFSCNEDKGNYDYADINKITEIKNIQDSYVVELGEQLLITPKLETLLGDLDDFDYTWYYEASSKNWKVLQEGKALDFIIDAPIGTPNKTYNCAFEAKNKKTEVTYRQLFTVRVNGSFGRGYVVLCEKESSFDMSMVVLNSQNQFVPKYNILANTAPDLHREGVKPYGIYIFDDTTAPTPYKTDNSRRSTYLLTDHYTTRLKTSDFSWDASYDISNVVEKNSPLYNEYVATGKPIIAEKIQFGLYNTGVGTIMPYPHTYFYIKDDAGKGNWYMYNTYPVLYLMSVPMNAERASKDRYEPAPFLACSSQSTVFFNAEENRFYLQGLPNLSDYSSSYFYTESFADESTDHLFNFNDENAGLLYMGERISSTSSFRLFAILKQKDGTFKYIEFNGQSTAARFVLAANKLRTCIFDAASGIDKAKFIAAAPTPNEVYLYYVTEDNRVYYADLSNARAVVRDITEKVLPKGYDEVTAFRFAQPGASGLNSSLSKSLGIASYNSALGKDKGGRLDFYTMPSISSGELEKAVFEVNEEERVEMSWTGFGKIVSFDYKP